MMDELAKKLLSDKSIDIEDLVGEHVLTGVEEFYSNDSNEFCLVLDGIVFSFLEDPDDGYRSLLGEVLIGRREIKNTFDPVKVSVIKNPDEDSETILGLVGDRYKVLFEVGTNYSDDYYPCFVSSFSPEILEDK